MVISRNFVQVDCDLNDEYVLVLVLNFALQNKRIIESNYVQEQLLCICETH